MNPFFSSRNCGTGALMALGLSALMAGCNGGNGGPQTQATPTPTTNATPFATPTPTLSAASSRIVLGTVNTTIPFVVRADGSQRTALRNISSDNLAISRDGRTLAAPDYNGQVADILVAHDGSMLRRLANTTGFRFINNLSISADGRLLTFGAGPGFNNGTDLYVCDVASGRMRRLTKTRDSEFDPTFSPDGRRLAFASSPPQLGGFNYSEIQTINVDGSNRKSVPNSQRLQEPDWSPDGGSLLCSDSSTPDGSIVRINVDGSGSRVIAAKGIRPMWSPDGSRFAFELSGRRAYTNQGLSYTTFYNVFVADADGARAHRITANGVAGGGLEGNFLLAWVAQMPKSPIPIGPQF